MNPNGSRWWRFKYYFGGKERGISLGVYPDVPLKYAREQREAARKLVARSIDPSVERRTKKIALENSFKLIAEEWLAMQSKKLAEITMAKARWILSSFIYPRLGSRPVAEITAPELLTVLRPIESRGMNETAHRALQRCSQVFRYAIATGRATRDITSDLRGALAPVVVENFAAITEPQKIGAGRLMVTKLADPEFVNGISATQSQALLPEYQRRFGGQVENIQVLQRVVLMTPENIHLNSFMYEPILDMSDEQLRKLYKGVLSLK